MRKIKSVLFFSGCGISLVFSLSILVIVVGSIVLRGAPAISLEFLTQESKAFGEEGGILYQVIGTIILITGAGIISLPLGYGTAIYQTDYLRTDLRKWGSIMTYALNGVPTILFGLFGYIIFGVYLHLGISWTTGSFILAIMILPTLIISIRESIESIPLKYREAGLSLGFSRWQLIRTIIIPQSFPGMITGLLLGLARAAGETAAIMFTATAFSGVTIPRSFYEPVTSLQTHILVLSQEALNPAARTNAWGAALVLVVLVFFMNTAAMWTRMKLPAEAEK